MTESWMDEAGVRLNRGETDEQIAAALKVSADIVATFREAYHLTQRARVKRMLDNGSSTADVQQALPHVSPAIIHGHVQAWAAPRRAEVFDHLSAGLVRDKIALDTGYPVAEIETYEHDFVQLRRENARTLLRRGLLTPEQIEAQLSITHAQLIELFNEMKRDEAAELRAQEEADGGKAQ